jgi:hypothetical protein
MDRDLAKKQRQVAELFVKTAGAPDRKFDFSEDSVKRLDDFVDTLWPKPPSEEELDSLTKLMGAYLGEVMIRTVGGEWRWTDERRVPVLANGTTSAFVLDKVYRRQTVGPTESLTAFYDAYRSRFGNASPNDAGTRGWWPRRR